MSDFWDSLNPSEPPAAPGVKSFWDTLDSTLKPSKEDLKATNDRNRAAEAATPGVFSEFMGGLGRMGAAAGQAVGELVPNVVKSFLTPENQWVDPNAERNAPPLTPEQQNPGLLQVAGRVAGQVAPFQTAIAKPVVESAKAVINPYSTPEEAGTGLGNLTALAATPALGRAALGAVSKVAPLVKSVAPAVSEMAEGGARRLIGSELKLNKGEVQFSKDPIRAILDEKLTGNSHEDLLQNVTQRKDEIMGRVEDRLAASNKMIPRNDITAILDNEVARLKDSVGVTNKEALLSKIETIQSEVLQKYPERLTLTDALKLRREIDDGIVRWTSDAVEQGANKAKYELRSGINREIEKQAPGTKADNRRVSELIDVENALSRRVQQAEKADIIPHTLTGLAVKGAELATGVTSTAIKTRLAQYLNKLAPAEKVAFEALPEAEQLSTAGIKMSQEETPSQTMSRVGVEVADRDMKLKKYADQFPDGTVIQGWEKKTIGGDTFWTKGKRTEMFLHKEIGAKALLAEPGPPKGQMQLKMNQGEEVPLANAGESIRLSGLTKSPLLPDFEPPAVISYKPETGKLVLNDAAMNKFNKAIGGKNVQAAEVKVLGEIPKLKKLMPDEFGDVREGEPLTVQRQAEVQKHKEEARHEGTHRAINEPIEIIPEKLPERGDTQMLYSRAMERKLGQYDYKDIPEEIFADLASGNTSRLAMTRTEGLQLLTDMVDQIEKEYGPERVGEMMTRFAPKFGEFSRKYHGLKIGELSQFFPYTPKGEAWAKRGIKMSEGEDFPPKISKEEYEKLQADTSEPYSTSNPPPESKKLAEEKAQRKRNPKKWWIAQ